MLLVRCHRYLFMLVISEARMLTEHCLYLMDFLPVLREDKVNKIYILLMKVIYKADIHTTVKAQVDHIQSFPN